MYKIFISDAIVLSRRDLSDFSVLSCYTEEYGIIDIWQIHSSKNFRAMDYFYFVNLKFSEIKSRDTVFFKIIDFEIIDYNYNIRNDLRILNIANYFVNILSKKIFKDSKEIFYLLKNFLCFINQNEFFNKFKFDVNILKFIFFLKILKLDGYEFQIKECIGCKTSVPKSIKTLYFSVDSGGVICNKCVKKLNSYEFSDSVLINKEMLKLLNICYNNEIYEMEFILSSEKFINTIKFLGFNSFFKKISRYYI